MPQFSPFASAQRARFRLRALYDRVVHQHASSRTSNGLTAVIAGCARNAAPHLPGVLRNIEGLASLYDRCAFVFVENDSTDNTRTILEDWTGMRRNAHLVAFAGNSKDYPKRTARLARARNSYLDFIRISPYSKFDHLIVMDLDDVNAAPLPLTGARTAIEYLCESPSRRAVFANALPAYYDIWALRHASWCPDDCWSGFTPGGDITLDDWATREVFPRQRFIPSDRAAIPVQSAFGGLGIYRMNSALASRYAGISELGGEYCEHVSFNRGVAQEGELAVIPALMVTAPPAHLAPALAQLPAATELVLDQDDYVCRLLSPATHPLARYRKEHPLYDRRLPLLARLVGEASPDQVIVDVGANIGDTIALCRLAGCHAPMIAVEPSAQYWTFLDANVRAQPELFANVRCVNAFIGSPNSQYELVEDRGTAHITRSRESSAGNLPRVPTYSFEMLNGGEVSMIKIDTDGFDAAILKQNLAFLARERPIVWAEADTRDAADAQEWSDALIELTAIYQWVCVFDNFGFLITRGELSQKTQLINDLISYTRRHKAAPSDAAGEPRIYYLDLAFFPAAREDVYSQFVQNLREA